MKSEIDGVNNKLDTISISYIICIYLNRKKERCNLFCYLTHHYIAKIYFVIFFKLYIYFGLYAGARNMLQYID